MKNFVKFEVKGLNQESFFNELSKKFCLFEIDRVNKNHCIFKAKPKDKKFIKKQLESNNFTIINIEHMGIFYKILKCLLSYGVIAGILIGSIFYFIQGLYIRKIEVWGNQDISDAEIIEYIDCALDSKLKSAINTKLLENKIYNNFDGLSFVSIAIIGQTLVINIKEEIRPEEMGGEFEPLYSDFDGIITEIQLIQGTLCVSVGDIIQAGQVLVLPYIINSNGEKLPVKAVANIFADVWISAEEIHNSCYDEIYRTGNKQISNEVYLAGLKIYEKIADVSFKSFELVEELRTLNKNNILPFKLKTTTYFETAKRNISIPFEEVKTDLILKAKEKALQKLKEYDIIKEEKTVLKQVGNITNLTYLITVKRNIGG